MRQPAAILFVFLFLLGGFGIVHAGGNDDGKCAYRKGKRHMKRYDYIRAIPYFKECTNLAPDNAWYHFLYGKALFEGDRPRMAAEALSRAYNLDRSIHPDIKFYLSRALHLNGDYETALAIYNSDLSRYEEGSDEYRDTEMRILQCRNGMRAGDNQEYYKVENMGDYVNTPYPEYAATFADNYSYMIFTTRRPRTIKQMMGRRYIVEDISEEVYQASLIDGKWRKSRLFSKPIPRSIHDASVAISEDGKTMYYYLARNGGDIYISNQDEEGDWSKKKSIGETINTEDYNEPHAVIADYGKALYFVSDKPGGKGLKDLYVAYKEGDAWGEPINLEMLNTPYDEDGPFLSADGKTLYFASRGHSSIGGYDLFKSTKMGDTWSKPENLGQPINSTGDDIYFVQEGNGEGFYFSSDRPGGFGEKDLYYAAPFIPETQSTIVAGIVRDESTMAPVAAQVSLIRKSDGEVLETMQTSDDGKYRFSRVECGEEYEVDVLVPAGKGGVERPTGSYHVVTGFVQDAINEKPLASVVELIDPETEEVMERVAVNPETGNYIIPVISGKQYRLRVNANEYLPYYEEFSVTPTGQVVAHTHEVALQRKNEANKLVITWQFFEYDKFTIKRDYLGDLENVVEVMQKVPEISLNIVGHTDGDGSKTYNQKLSEQRARSVADYLIEKGIAKDRLNVIGMGETMPIYDNNDPEAKKWNRRVELFIVN